MSKKDSWLGNAQKNIKSDTFMKYVLFCVFGLFMTSMDYAVVDATQVDCAEVQVQVASVREPTESLRALVERDPQFEETSKMQQVPASDLMMLWMLFLAEIAVVGWIAYDGAHT
jgi:hypothetical protein